MSTTLIWWAFCLAGVLILVLLPLAWWLVPKWPGHRRFKSEELQLKSETEMRHDASHVILGIGAIVTVLLSVATYVNSVEKEKLERRQNLIAQLGSASASAQTDAIRQLGVIWRIEEPNTVHEHLEVLRSFLQTHAQRQFLTPSTAATGKSEDLLPVDRNRPPIEAALAVLSQLNKGRVLRTPDDRIVLKDLDLRYLDLRSMDFHGVDFSSCVLVGSNLSRCDLSNGKLYSAFIMSTDFSGAMLNGADFRWTRVDPSTAFSAASVDRTDFGESLSNDKEKITELTVNPDVIGKPLALGQWHFKFDPKKDVVPLQR